MTSTIRPDSIFGVQLNKPGTILNAGEEYPAVANKYGAISGICANGELLGVKPGEFDFVTAPKWVLDIWIKEKQE